MTKNKMTSVSRRRVLQTVAALGAAAVTSRSEAQQKIAKTMVQYQDKAKNDQECDKCLHFVAPDACKIVDGKISPKGWCAVYAAKPK